MSSAKDEMLVTMTRDDLASLLRAVMREARANEPAPSKRYLSAKDIAAHFGVSRSTVQSWVREQCPHIARGKVLRFELEAIEEWIRGRRPGLRSVR